MAGIGINNGVINYGGVPSAGAGLLANRPAFGVTGRLYIGTDTNALYRDTGSAWVTISAGISGTAATGQATFWSSATTISGDNAFFWDNTNKRLGLGTATPGVRLDVHGTGVIQQINATGGTNNGYIDYQNAGTTQYRIGYTYNGGSRQFQILDIIGAVTSISISSSNNISIGSNTIASYKLHAFGSIGSGSSVTNDPGSLNLIGGNAGAAFTITPDIITGANGVIYNTSFVLGGSGPHIFQIGGSEKARLSNTGFGIGYNPNLALSVNGSIYQGSNTANSNFQLLCSGNFYTGGLSPTFFTYTAGPVSIPLTNTGLVFKTAATITATLPLASGINNQYYIVVLAGTVVTLNRSGSDNIINTVGATVTSLTLTGYTKTLLYSDGGTTWYQLF